MKKLIVFGATGGTGKEVVSQALALGHRVIAVVRNPIAIAITHPQLLVVRGDVLQPSSFEEYMAGADAILSCLGTGTNLKPTKIYSEGLQNILSAMKKSGVKRVMCVSAGALYTNAEMGFFIRLLTKAVLQRILKNIYCDMRIMEETVAQSDLEWTIVRPPRLTHKPVSGKYRVAVHTHIRRPFSIARADVAHYLLNNMSNAETFGAKVEIAY